MEDPLTFTADLYNASVDYLADGVDAMEAATAELTGDALPDSAKAGFDELLYRLRWAYDTNFDIFELYALQNIFTPTAGTAVPSTAPAADPATDELALNRIHALKAAVLKARSRNRALRRAHEHYKAHLPGVEAGVAGLADAMAAAGGAGGVSKAAAAHGAAAASLQDLTNQLKPVLEGGASTSAE